MAFWAAALPIAQAAGGMLLSEDEKQKQRMQGLSVSRQQVTTPPKDSSMDLGSMMQMGQAVSGGMSGGGSQSKGLSMPEQDSAVSRRLLAMDEQNKNAEILERARSAASQYPEFKNEFEILNQASLLQKRKPRSVQGGMV